MKTEQVKSQCAPYTPTVPQNIRSQNWEVLLSVNHIKQNSHSTFEIEITLQGRMKTTEEKKEKRKNRKKQKQLWVLLSWVCVVVGNFRLMENDNGNSEWINNNKKEEEGNSESFQATGSSRSFIVYGHDIRFIESAALPGRGFSFLISPNSWNHIDGLNSWQHFKSLFLIIYWGIPFLWFTRISESIKTPLIFVMWVRDRQTEVQFARVVYRSWSSRFILGNRRRWNLQPPRWGDSVECRTWFACYYVTVLRNLYFFFFFSLSFNEIVLWILLNVLYFPNKSKKNCVRIIIHGTKSYDLFGWQKEVRKDEKWEKKKKKTIELSLVHLCFSWSILIEIW